MEHTVLVSVVLLSSLCAVVVTSLLGKMGN